MLVFPHDGYSPLVPPFLLEPTDAWHNVGGLNFLTTFSMGCVPFATSTKDLLETTPSQRVRMTLPSALGQERQGVALRAPG